MLSGLIQFLIAFCNFVFYVDFACVCCPFVCMLTEGLTRVREHLGIGLTEGKIVGSIFTPFTTTNIIHGRKPY